MDERQMPTIFLNSCNNKCYLEMPIFRNVQRIRSAAVLQCWRTNWKLDSCLLDSESDMNKIEDGYLET
mgnify:CR=1 FL=1